MLKRIIYKELCKPEPLSVIPYRYNMKIWKEKLLHSDDEAIKFYWSAAENRKAPEFSGYNADFSPNLLKLPDAI